MPIPRVEFSVENANCKDCPAYDNICESGPDKACVIFRKNLKELIKRELMTDGLIK